MKTYTHSNGMKAEEIPHTGRFVISSDYTTDWREIILTEQELLDFGFIEDKQEDWIEQLIKEINIWNTNTDISKELYNRHSDFLRTAILKHLPK